MNDGFINEEILREYINNHNYLAYNSNIQKFLSFVFKENLNTLLPFQAGKKGGQNKPDLYITHNRNYKIYKYKKRNWK